MIVTLAVLNFGFIFYGSAQPPPNRNETNGLAPLLSKGTGRKGNLDDRIVQDLGEAMRHC